MQISFTFGVARLSLADVGKTPTVCLLKTADYRFLWRQRPRKRETRRSSWAWPPASTLRCHIAECEVGHVGYFSSFIETHHVAVKVVYLGVPLSRSWSLLVAGNWKICRADYDLRWSVISVLLKKEVYSSAFMFVWLVVYMQLLTWHLRCWVYYLAWRIWGK